MKLLPTLLCAALLVAGNALAPTVAGDADPLFINLTTDDPHRANMAITFGRNQFERGHPLTIFLNDKGVFIGAKQNASTFGSHQVDLATLMDKGAQVLICPMCMKHYGVGAGDLIPGLEVGNPDLTGGALFKDDTQTLTW